MYFVFKSVLKNIKPFCEHECLASDWQLSQTRMYVSHLNIKKFNILLRKTSSRGFFFFFFKQLKGFRSVNDWPSGSKNVA